MAAILTWVWGSSPPSLVALLAQRGRPGRVGDVRLLVGAVAAVWAVATAVAVIGPEIVTDSDPARVPICALLAPIAAMMFTSTAFLPLSSLDGRRTPS